MAKSSTFLSNPRVRLLLIAIALGAVASLLTDAYIQRNISQAKGGPTEKIIFVAKAVDKGQQISQEDLTEREVPSEYVQPRVLQSSFSKDLLEMGASASRDLTPGQPLTADDIALEEKSSLSDYLSLNQRAVTLSVSNNNSFNNMIEPGDRIDILTMDRGDNLSGSGQMKVLLQNVYVLATNDNLQRKLIVPTTGNTSSSSSSSSASNKAISSITVRVSFEDAIRLSYHDNQGSLTFLLRNRNDIFEYDPNTMTVGTAQQSQETASTSDTTQQSLAQAPDDYPMIYEEGQPSRSAYFPSQQMMSNNLSDMQAQGIEALKRKATSSQPDPGKPSPQPANSAPATSSGSN